MLLAINETGEALFEGDKNVGWKILVTCKAKKNIDMGCFVSRAEQSLDFSSKECVHGALKSNF